MTPKEMETAKNTITMKIIPEQNQTTKDKEIMEKGK